EFARPEDGERHARDARPARRHDRARREGRTDRHSQRCGDIFLDPVIPSATTDERVAAGRAGLTEAARFGVTAFVDMSSGEAYEDFRAYQQLEKSGDLTARVYLYTPILEYKRLVAASVEKAFGGD